MQVFKLPDAQKVFLDILNQIFEIEKKLEKIQESNTISRNLEKLKNIFATELYADQAGLIIHNPLGENYDSTRIDCDASIAGESTENLVITEVIKPIIHYRSGGINHIVQKAVVIVQSKDTINQS
ncbi:MAG: hypothetical protein RML72_05115 [Bacteroidia bacterium]|nr:hypothetical protein [Bacteroidia bacterium]MDW8158244.1 hypothetical protein [Bacteroidia bacterium]